MSERFICTKDDPWTKEKGTPAQHPDAVSDGECFEGCCDRYKCPNCGLRFTEEVPE